MIILTRRSGTALLLVLVAGILSSHAKAVRPLKNNQDVNNIFQFSQHKNMLPDEISFCIVDLKFDGSLIKICEFGEGIESTYKGYDALHGKGAMWSHVWRALRTFNQPLWCTSKHYWQKNLADIAGHEFTSHGGRFYTSQRGLEADHAFIKTQNPSNHGDLAVTPIVIMPSLGLAPDTIKKFKQHHPNTLVLGEVTTAFVKNKHATNALFNDSRFAPYKPKFKEYSTKYNATLAATIINDLQAPLMVIKPLYAALGQGVIIVAQKDLDTTLKLILASKKQLGRFGGDTSYSHWARNKDALFVVEEFVPSKTIYVHAKPYDGTMRVTFMLSNKAGRAGLAFLGAYWKLPAQPLDMEGSLNEKHKSNMKASRVSSAVVSDEDFVSVKKQLSVLLPELYHTMLVQSFATLQLATLLQGDRDN